MPCSMQSMEGTLHTLYARTHFEISQIGGTKQGAYSLSLSLHLFRGLT